MPPLRPAGGDLPATARGRRAHRSLASSPCVQQRPPRVARPVTDPARRIVHGTDPGGSRRARWARTSPWRRTGGCHRLREDIPHAVLRGRWFSHLHLHLVPRLPNDPEDARGPHVFAYLTDDQAQWLPRRNATLSRSPSMQRLRRVSANALI